MSELPSKSLIRKKESLTAVKEERNSDDSIKTLGSRGGLGEKQCPKKSKIEEVGVVAI